MCEVCLYMKSAYTQVQLIREFGLYASSAYTRVPLKREFDVYTVPIYESIIYTTFVEWNEPVVKW